MNEQSRIHIVAAPPEEEAPARVRRRVWPRALAMLVLMALGAAAYYYYPQQTARRDRLARRGDDGPVPVLVAKPRHADIPLYLDGVGTVKALNTVTVKPQVDGQLLSINFREGQDVGKGEVLAKVDPRTYQAQLDQAVARKTQDEANLANAKLDLDRYEKLMITNAGTQKQVDTQKAMVAQLEAQILSDKAAIDNARIYLGWTDVRAPIEGRAGIRNLDEGNIVRAADPAGLVVLTQLRPISVFFNAPQQELPNIVKGQSKGELTVEALAPDGKTVADRGQLQVIDNQVDTTTGTVRLKAELPNQNLALWPGAFVNVRLLTDTLRNVVVVPTAAVQRGPNGTFVYVLAEGDKVAMRPVGISYQDEQRSVVTSGLADDESVVTTGFAQLTDGKAVRVTAAASAPAGGGGIGMGNDAQRRRDGGEGRRERRQGEAQRPPASGASP
jgi:membrane fusion protein, multidrug efflux system